MNITLPSLQVISEIQCPDHTSVFPKETDDLKTVDIGAALLKPMELPRLALCVVPGDRVCIVVDPDTPEVDHLLNAVKRQFLDTVSAELDITILLPEDSSGQNWNWLTEQRSNNSNETCAQTAVHIHDPKDEQQVGYLASTAGGERVYLNPLIIDADLIITVGSITWDSTIGVRGTTSAIYPTLSNEETISGARKLSHVELNPSERHPRRDIIDEIGWLIGTQFAVQVIPNSEGNIGRILCGAPEAVMKEARQQLTEHKQIHHPIDADLIVLSIPAMNGRVTWKDLGLALSTASRLIDSETRIAVVADLPDSSGPAWQMLQRCNEPTDLIKPLSLEPTPDAVETIQLIQTLRNSTVFMLSQLPSDLVEDLGLLPLENTDELQRLIDQADHVAILRGANFLAAT